MPGHSELRHFRAAGCRFDVANGPLTVWLGLAPRLARQQSPETYVMAAAQPVDYQHLEAQAAGNLSVMREVLELFVAHCEQVIGELERTDDAKTWKQWTHTLKGSARGVGAFAMAEAAADAERHSLDKTKIEPLRIAFVEARTFIGQNPL